MAKGLEDTVFYIYNRLAALNEVGGEPQQFRSERRGVSPAESRIDSATGRRRLLATSTHDTKRSEDVRARMVAISEIPELWRRSLATLAHGQSPVETNDRRHRGARRERGISALSNVARDLADRLDRRAEQAAERRNTSSEFKPTWRRR